MPWAFEVLLLAACAGAPRDDTGVSPTPYGGCALSSPFPIASTADVSAALAALPTDDARLVTLLELALANAEADCPTVSQTDGIDEISGDCTTSVGATYAGRLFRGTSTADGAVTTTWDFDHFELESADDAVAADGTWRLVTAGPDTQLSVLLLLDAPVGGGLFDVGLVTEAGAVTGDAYMYLAGGAAGSGDYCVAVATTPGCEAEDDGTITVSGTREAVVTWDGSAVCDGCGDVTIAGVAADALCE